MSAVAVVGQRYLPRGWRDLALQFGIWFGFLAAYQVVRGMADRSPAEAFANGLRVVSFETSFSQQLWELSLQQFVSTKEWLAPIVSWTYWNSEFTVLGLALLWIYLRRHDAFTRFRNAILLANVLGLVGYVLVPMAPPRLLGVGFVNQHRDGLLTIAANPYAAMPSLHAADALILGIVLAVICRNWWSKAFWGLWPAWVWFAVMATGNHFWLDCVAGMVVALVAMSAIYGRPVRAAIAARRR
ncbi:MAG TPA: phosphatase PAP2 family protein [Gaiellaceae bacterium]